MSSATMTAEPRITDILRGNRDNRPVANRAAAGHYRQLIEGALEKLTTRASTHGPLVIRSHHLDPVPFVHIGPTFPLAQLRGALISELLRLLSTGHSVRRPFEDAREAWAFSHPHSPLHLTLEECDADDLARVATDVTAHAVTLIKALGPVNPHWQPRTDVSVMQHFRGGDIVVRDRLDLVLGSSREAVASEAVFDVTTSPLSSRSDAVLRYHALMETLRTGVVPLRVVALSTATGERVQYEVNDALLARAVSELQTAIIAEWNRP